MTPTAPRPLAHLELHTADLGSARAFYSELLGWRPELIEAAERSYLALDLAKGRAAGLSSAAPSGRCGSPTYRYPRSAPRPTAQSGWAARSCWSRARARPAGAASCAR